VSSLFDLVDLAVHLPSGLQSVALQDGGVFTFGAGMYGQLGHNLNQSESLPRKVFELMGSEVTMLACGRLVLNAFHYLIIIQCLLHKWQCRTVYVNDKWSYFENIFKLVVTTLVVGVLGKANDVNLHGIDLLDFRATHIKAKFH